MEDSSRFQDTLDGVVLFYRRKLHLRNLRIARCLVLGVALALGPARSRVAEGDDLEHGLHSFLSALLDFTYVPLSRGHETFGLASPRRHGDADR